MTMLFPDAMVYANETPIQLSYDLYETCDL